MRQHPAEHDVNVFLPLCQGGTLVWIPVPNSHPPPPPKALRYHIGLEHCWLESWRQWRQKFFCPFFFSLYVCIPKMLRILRRIQK